LLINSWGKKKGGHSDPGLRAARGPIISNKTKKGGIKGRESATSCSEEEPGIQSKRGGGPLHRGRKSKRGVTDGSRPDLKKRILEVVHEL